MSIPDEDDDANVERLLDLVEDVAEKVGGPVLYFDGEQLCVHPDLATQLVKLNDALVVLLDALRGNHIDAGRAMCTKRQTKRDEERRLAEDARLVRGWFAWHRDERKAVLAGSHGPMFERLLFILKGLTLKSAPLLLAYVHGVDWSKLAHHSRARKNLDRRPIDLGSLASIAVYARICVSTVFY